MTDASSPASGQSGLVIPAELLEQYRTLISLIQESESMKVEEQQYWINILPVMTPDQRQNLQDILDNERKQLAAIDEKYAKEVESVSSVLPTMTDEEKRKKREERRAKESINRTAEEQTAEAILDQIEES
jgi:hypothetical protein